jgi:hypothetical protein
MNDIQMAFNVLVGLVAFFGGWVLNNITKTLDRLDTDVRNFPKNYVVKEDYRRDIDELKSICHQIFDRLDNKADK